MGARVGDFFYKEFFWGGREGGWGGGARVSDFFIFLY